MRVRTARFVAACAAITAAPFVVKADLLVDAGPASVSQTFTTGNYVAGTEFTISAPTTIRSLGWLDAEGDGITANHRIGLWSVATQTLLTSGMVTPNSPTLPSAQGTAKWFMVGIPALVLQPGTYRVAGEVSGDNVALSNNKIAGPNTTLTAGYIRTDFPSGGFAYPNLTFASEAVRATVSTDAVATLIVDAGKASVSQVFTTGNYVAGSEFTISAPTTIRSLGWLDAEGDGITVNHIIGLWSVATQTLLTSATITPASVSVRSANGTAKWFMEGVPDLVLAPGTYRVAGEVSGDNVALSNDKIAGPSTTLTAGYVRTDFPSGGFAYPNLTFASEAVRATASVDAVSSVIVDAGPAATTTTFATGNYVAGSEFTLSVPTTMRSLGWLDLEGDGLSAKHRIGLWNVATQTLLASTTVDGTSASVASAHGPAKWFMGRIPDIQLPAGVYRVAGEVSGDNIALVGNKIPGPNTTITAGYIRTDFPNGGFAYPNLTFGTDAVRSTLDTQAITDLLVDAGPAATVQTFNTGNYVAGTEFTISEPTTIRSLGYLDAEGDGLAANHNVGLWAVATQTLVTSGTVTPGSPTIISANGTGKWFMVGVPDVVLLPGVYRVAGEVAGDLNSLSNDKLPGPSTSLSAGYVRTDFPNGGFAYPNLSFGSETVRATASTRSIVVTATCYANCDASTSAPCLNVNDFICFNNFFAAGAPYANCDLSTIPPILNVNDFICFNNKFAAGCTSPCAAP